MVIREKRYCACEKCGNCKRDGQQGLCTYLMDPKSNMLCGDCEVEKCNPAGLTRYLDEEQRKFDEALKRA